MLIFEKVSLLSFFAVLFNKSLLFVPCKIDFAADSLTHTANTPLPIYTAPQFQNEFPDALRLSFKRISQIHCASISKRVRVQNFHKKNEFALHECAPVCGTHVEMNGFAQTRFDTEGTEAARKWPVHVRNVIHICSVN